MNSMKYVALSLALCLLMGFSAAGDFVVWPYLRDLRPDGVTVIWETNEVTSGSVSFGRTQEYTQTVESPSGTMHYVTLAGLEPDTLYYYRVMVNAGESSTPAGDVEHSFRTALVGGGSFEFVVYADTNSGRRGSDVDHGRVIRSIATHSNPEFILLPGDIVNDGRSKEDWWRFFQVENQLIRRVPIYAVMGNNDLGGEVIFHQYFTHPREEPWYSFTYGNSFFIGLSVLRGQGDQYYKEFRPGNPQFIWLLEQLQSEANQNADFTFVFFHAPVIAPDDSQNTVLAEMLHPLFLRYGVDMVFNGTHSFTWAEKDGIHYIISGGGGGEMVPSRRASQNPEIRDIAYFLHHLRVRVNHPVITVQVVDTLGSVYQSFDYWARDVVDPNRPLAVPPQFERSEPQVGRIPLELYSLPNCAECDRIMTRIIPRVQQESGVELPVTFYSLDNPDSFERLVWLETILGDTNNELPALVIGNTILGGERQIRDHLGGMVASYAAGETHWDTPELTEVDLYEAISRRFGAFSAAVIILAGLLDGVNPCAFTSIIFLLSYLYYLGRSKREVLVAGSSFALGVLITYMLLGAGFSQLLGALVVFRSLAQVVKYLMFAFVLVLAVLSTYDFFLALRGRTKEITLQLPESLKKKIHAKVRTSTRKSRLLGASLSLGFFIAIFELACTGQVYLPTIMYMIQVSEQTLTAYGYLFVYNLAHIFPLVLVFILAYFGLTSETLSAFFKRRVSLIKLLTALLFASLAVMILLF